MTDNQIEVIHEASLRILERTGIRYDSEDARKRLVKEGAVVHPTRNRVITFPRSMVEDSILKIPRSGTYYARDPKWNVVYDGEHLYPYAGVGDPKIIDLDTGESRPSTLSDVEKAARLGDALENNWFGSSLVVASDVPPELLILKTVEATMKNSSKCLSTYAPDKETVDALVRMWACVVGGVEELRKRPLLNLAGSPSSPLTYAEHVCAVIIRSAEYGIPFFVVPCPICGETGPMALSGSIAQQNAETLGGIMLTQTITNELPTVYCGRICFMNPRSGTDLWGLPEEGLVSAAMAQMARRYHMSADSCGMTSDIPRWGLQMGLERMMTALLPALAGCESISGMGSGWEGASSLEMMVIDNEICNDVARILQGVDVDDDGLALDLLDNVGHMGNFLAQPHTMNRLRSGEVRTSKLWDKRSNEKMMKEGFRQIHEVARERVKCLLEEHVPVPLDRDVEKDIRLIMKDAFRASRSRR